MTTLSSSREYDLVFNPNINFNTYKYPKTNSIVDFCIYYVINWDLVLFSIIAVCARAPIRAGVRINK